MPLHDWTRVDAGVFHDFHNAWITHLKEALNGGLLPDGYYALAEQHAGQVIADVLTLQTGAAGPAGPRDEGPVALAEAPPRVSRKVVPGPNAAYRAARRTVAIRHVSNHRIVALIEVLSPANKDRPSSVADFVGKVHAALRHGCHVTVIDLFPPGQEDSAPPGKPLTLAAYQAGTLPEAFLEPVRVGDVLPDIPLFLQPGRYVYLPLEPTYQQAYRGLPGYWRGVLEAR